VQNLRKDILTKTSSQPYKLIKNFVENEEAHYPETFIPFIYERDNMN
jgi:hypothetical protein